MALFEITILTYNFRYDGAFCLYFLVILMRQI